MRSTLLASMAGYKVMGTLSGVTPHWARHLADNGAGPLVPAELVSEPPVDLVGRPWLAGLVDWWLGVREAWSQTIFFLFDPNSWR